MIQSTTTGITKRIGCECWTIQSFDWELRDLWLTVCRTQQQEHIYFYDNNDNLISFNCELHSRQYSDCFLTLQIGFVLMTEPAGFP